ncbi:hypothetical protein DL765_002510 [Monosporascus sp. GIB2]|nr:hypothetical protein DL765_002510 [Monosporascus sp. GIB2]
MQLTALFAAFASAQTVSAWRVHFYNHKTPCADDCGGHSTKGGPGRPGTACHQLWEGHDGPNLNNEVSQLSIYPNNPALNTRCCFRFYNAAGCAESSTLFTTCDQWVEANLVPAVDNKISSYRTNCEYGSSAASMQLEEDEFAGGWNDTDPALEHVDSEVYEEWLDIVADAQAEAFE